MSIDGYGSIGTGLGGLSQPDTQVTTDATEQLTGTETQSEGQITAQNVQQQLDNADPNITFKKASLDTVAKNNLDMTDQSTKDQPEQDPPVRSGPSSTVDRFLEVVAKTWPTPEILSIDFAQKPGQRIEKISVKVKVSGDFLDDEWFWADFLKYFKTKVYLVPYMADTNNDIYNVSLFSEEPRELSALEERTFKDVQYFQPLNLPIPLMENKSGNLNNTYIYESTLDVAKPTELFNLISRPQSTESIGSAALKSSSFVTLGGKQTPSIQPIEDLKDMRIGIIARTYFDKSDFKEDYFGKSADPIFEELRKSINGKWDLVQFDIDSTGKITSGERYYATLPSTNVLWNAAFDFSEAKQQYLATDNTGIYPDSPLVLFKSEDFRKSNWPLLLMQEEAKKTINKDKKIEKKNFNPNNKLKFEVNQTLGDAFSDAYIAKQLNGEVSVSFSFDYLEVFKQISDIPDEIFNNIQENIEGNIIRKINIIDADGKDLVDGKYRYLVDVRVENRIDKYVEESMEQLNNALEQLKVYTREVEKPENVDPQTLEISESFSASSGNGSLANVQTAIESFFNVLEIDLLDYFVIKRFMLKRRRIKDDNNIIEFNIKDADSLVSRANEAVGTSLGFADSPDLFTEFGMEDLTFDFTEKFGITREQALQFAEPENLTPERVGQFKQIILEYQKDVLSLIREDNTPSANSEILTGRKSSTNSIVDNTIILEGVYDAKKASTGFSFGDPQSLDILQDSTGISLDQIKYQGQDIIQNEAVDSYLLNNIASIQDVNKVAPSTSNLNVGTVMFSSLSLDEGYDFQLVTTPESMEKTDSKESDQVEVLDIGEQKFTVNEEDNSLLQLVQQETVQNFFNSISSEATPPPPVELEYLAGYDVDENGKSILKQPIFSPASSLTEEDQGKEMLFRVKRTEKGVELPIYNEYFVKKV